MKTLQQKEKKIGIINIGITCIIMLKVSHMPALYCLSEDKLITLETTRAFSCMTLNCFHCNDTVYMSTTQTTVMLSVNLH